MCFVGVVVGASVGQSANDRFTFFDFILSSFCVFDVLSFAFCRQRNGSIQSESVQLRQGERSTNRNVVNVESIRFRTECCRRHHASCVEQVCLSLLGTWHGGGERTAKWSASHSSILQAINDRISIAPVSLLISSILLGNILQFDYFPPCVCCSVRF